MDLSEYAGVLRRWSLTLVAAALVAGAIAYVVGSRVPPVYASQVQVIVGPINTDQNTLRAAQELVPTYAQLVTTDQVLGGVIDELVLDLSLAELRENIVTRGEGVTRIVTIDVVAGDPEVAADTANALADGLDEIASGSQVRPEGQVTVIRSATVNPDPVEPQVAIIVVLAVAAGVTLALAFVLLVDYLSNTVRSPDDIREITQAPFLGAIAAPRRFRPGARGPLVTEVQPDSRAALSYRLVASRISAGDASGTTSSIVVLGAEDHAGSGEVAANLAAVIARSGRTVRLVDANDQDREISRLFGLAPVHALSELAHGEASLIDRLVQRQPPGIDVVPNLPGRDPRPLDHERALAVLAKLTAGVDLVILHTTPIHRSSSAFLWARCADGVVLVAQRDKTDRDSVTFAVEALRMLGTPLIGTLFHNPGRKAAEDRADDRVTGRLATIRAEAEAAADVELSDASATSSSRRGE